MSRYLKKCEWLPEVPEIPLGLKPIPGFPFYCISNDGTVYSCRGRGGLFRSWLAMTPGWNHPKEPSKSRQFVSLRRGKELLSRTVHRLVLEAFIGPCPEGMEGCHNDGNPSNNSVSNLRWDTHSSNMEDRKAHGRNPSGESNPACILTESEVALIRTLHQSGAMQKDLAPLFGVAKQTISAVCNGDTWKGAVPA